MDINSDDETEEARQWKGSAGSIILINIAQNDKNIVNLCFQSTREIIRKTLKTSESQIVGVCLFGTQETKIKSAGLHNIIELMSLEKHTLQDFKFLKNIDVNSYEPAKSFNISDVFWQCARIFTNCKRTLSERTVFFMSKLNFAPPSNDRRPTLKRVVDLRNLGINLKFINVSQDQYEVDPFFVEVFKACSPNSSEVHMPKMVNDLGSITTLLQQRSHRNLATARLEFHIADGFSIGVGVYNLSRTQTLPKSENLDSETNERVTKKILVVKNVNTAAPDMSSPVSREVPLLKSEIVYYYETGGTRVEFTKDELSKMKNSFGPPSIKLLGFKPESFLQKEKWFLKSCSFLFPSEFSINGSTKAFKALHKACLDCKVVALCTLCTRINSTPKLVALTPVIKPLNLDVDIGFDIIYMPYLEHVKDLPNQEVNLENESHMSYDKVDYMVDLLSNLKLSYKPEMFENPKLQSHYRLIESLALEEEPNEPFVDTTKPSSKQFQEIDAESFYRIFGNFSVSQTAKRPASNAEESGSSKRVCSVTISEEDVKIFKGRLQTKQIEKFNVADLKKFIKHFVPDKLPALTGMKKNDLVQLVYDKIKC